MAESAAWPLCGYCGSELDFPRPLRGEDRQFAHAPKLLDCLHSACEACLHDARERSRGGGFRCECGEATDVSTEARIFGLAYDWCGVSRVRALAAALGEANCDECDEEAAADHWCESCGVGLCGDHARNHATSRKTAKHRVRPWAPMDGDRPPHIIADCDAHQGEDLRYACGHCLALGCRDCAAAGKHGCGGEGAWRPLDEAAADARTATLPQLAAKTHKLRRALGAGLDATDRVAAAVDAAARNARSDIRAATADVRAALDAREAELLQRVDAYASEAAQLLGDHRAVLEAFAAKADAVKGAAAAVAKGTFLGDQDAQLVSTLAAARQRLASIIDDLRTRPLDPPPLDAAALRVEFEPEAPRRIAALISAMGSLRTPNDKLFDTADDALSRAGEAKAHGEAKGDGDPFPAVELVVKTAALQGVVGRRMRRLQRLRDGDGDFGAPQQAAPAGFRADSWTVDVETVSEAPSGSVIARLVIVTEVDRRLQDVVSETHHVETLGDATPRSGQRQTLKITRRFSLQEYRREDARGDQPPAGSANRACKD
ncbi:hypothetical protein M885DRAFT_552747 [Pelagophyceae sp. CCMP2097]|nr:hypothetical protein M885DRAFT_552747 [Pelagophyceae sp. CCMP2097]